MAQRYDLLIVREDQNKKSWWTKIGAAFENRNGDGYQLIFEALPIPDKNGDVRVIMKTPSERPERIERTEYEKNAR